MTIALDHIVVPSKDKVTSAQFFARIFGAKVEEPMGRFTPVKVNEALTLQFDNTELFPGRLHLAFHIGDNEFDAILSRVKADKLPFGSRALQPNDMKLNDMNGGRGFYFQDPNGHLLEVFTRR
jgi:catechol 2,3-dioxygenase-like lactoylglutathione lyase family enzyme